RDAADLVLAELEQAGDRHPDDPVLVGERGTVGRVVLQVEGSEAELRAEPLGMDQRRFAGELGDPLLSAAADDRQQLLEAPDVLRAPLEAALRDRRCRALVVVIDVEAFAAGRALEGRVEQRRPVAAVAAGEFGCTGGGPGPIGLGAVRLYRVTHFSSFAADPAALVQFVARIKHMGSCYSTLSA